jgi:hypothetical protein
MPEFPLLKDEIEQVEWDGGSTVLLQREKSCVWRLDIFPWEQQWDPKSFVSIERHFQSHSRRLFENCSSHFSDKSFVGNDKHLSETTNTCRKRQTIVGNDKHLSETASVCRGEFTLDEKNLGRNIGEHHMPCRTTNDKHLIVGLCRFLLVWFDTNATLEGHFD